MNTLLLDVKTTKIERRLEIKKNLRNKRLCEITRINYHEWKILRVGLSFAATSASDLFNLEDKKLAEQNYYSFTTTKAYGFIRFRIVDSRPINFLFKRHNYWWPSFKRPILCLTTYLSQFLNHTTSI